MTKRTPKFKTKERSKDLVDRLNEVGERSDVACTERDRTGTKAAKKRKSELLENKKNSTVQESGGYDDPLIDTLFKEWETEEFEPRDFNIDVHTDSLESEVGYSSLFRQMHAGFVRMDAFHRSPAGGSLSIEEARKKAFHECTNEDEAKKRLSELMRLPLENLHFVDLLELQSFSPRVAERFWERAKREGRNEFESGHLAANISFPVGYMKGVWNIARYLGVRESFIDEWGPKGGIEVALIDMMAQSYFQWQYWLEQTVKRSETREQPEHPVYERWKEHRQAENKLYDRVEGYWFRPLVSEKEALEHAVQMADRFNRVFMRTLRQLRDLRRYTPLTINNPGQVNIASEGGQQVNVAEGRDISP